MPTIANIYAYNSKYICLSQEIYENHPPFSCRCWRLYICSTSLLRKAAQSTQLPPWKVCKVFHDSTHIYMFFVFHMTIYLCMCFVYPDMMMLPVKVVTEAWGVEQTTCRVIAVIVTIIVIILVIIIVIIAIIASIAIVIAKTPYNMAI